MRLLVLLAFAASLASADVSLTSPRATLVLTDQGACQSLTGATVAAPPQPFARVAVGGKWRPGNSATLTASTLRLGFADTDTVLVFAVQPAPQWLRLTLQAVEGARPERVQLRLPLQPLGHLGRRLNCAWNDRDAVCLLAATRQVDCGATREKTADVLQATTQDAPGPKLEGASVALLVTTRPELDATLRAATHALGLLTNEVPDGTPVKHSELTRGSYWFMSLKESDADRFIAAAKATGVRQLMLNSGSWCSRVGHYVINTNCFPEGEKSLKRFVDKLHAAGILVGMHCFASKVGKNDAYVTPVPDRRFWTDLRTQLPAAIDATQTTIKGGDLSQWPGSPVCAQKYWEGGLDKHREVILGDEIVRYESIGPEGVWDTFQGCQRGAWGTKAAAHPAGEAGRHYGVDGCINGYIIDQETTLLDQTTDRLAGVFNRCGFDMIYFDGGEDVDRTRFNYYVSNFQETVMRKIKRRPIIHMGTIMTHSLWHSFARSATVDVYLATLYGAIQAGYKLDKWPTVREHIGKSVNYLLSINEDLMPGELGWFGIWPKGKDTSGLMLDEVEYLMCKAVGYDAPISLETSFGQMDDHVLTPEILKIVGAYERLRLPRKVDEATRAKLRALGKDFALLQKGAKFEFVPVEPTPVGADPELARATVGERPGEALANVWPVQRSGQLSFRAPGPVSATDLDGKPVPLKSAAGATSADLSYRRLTLHFPGRDAAAVRAILADARVLIEPARRIVVPAASGKLSGEMKLGSAAGVQDPDAFGDVVVCTAQPDFNTVRDWYAEYEVQVPRAGRYNLWARVRYPQGLDMSFAYNLPPAPPSVSSQFALGNCGVHGNRWHWTAQGGGSTSVPPGSPITLTLPAGKVKLRVYAREGTGQAATNPRLDLLLLTDDLFEVPDDALARKLLAKP